MHWIFCYNAGSCWSHTQIASGEKLFRLPLDLMVITPACEYLCLACSLGELIQVNAVKQMCLFLLIFNWFMCHSRIYAIYINKKRFALEWHEWQFKLCSLLRRGIRLMIFSGRTKGLKFFSTGFCEDALEICYCCNDAFEVLPCNVLSTIKWTGTLKCIVDSKQIKWENKLLALYLMITDY